MESSGSGPAKPAKRGLYGSVPELGPPGMAPRLLEFADELLTEGVAVGTSELLDTFQALDAVSWSSREDFREALAATLAKSQEDRHVFDVLFERFFFRAVEREAIEQGLVEERFGGGEELDLEALRERIREAIRAGSDGEMRDRKSTRLNSSHRCISYAVFCLKKKNKEQRVEVWNKQDKPNVPNTHI